MAKSESLENLDVNETEEDETTEDDDEFEQQDLSVITSFGMT